MNAKYLVGTVIESIIKVVVLGVIIMLAFRGATTAYDFGYRVFADEPVSTGEGRTITVGIAKDNTVEDIGQMLEEKGLITDAKLFVVQELLSAYHDEILPGIYDLNTSMTAQEMLAIMSTPTADSETDDSESGEEVTEGLQ